MRLFANWTRQNDEKILKQFLEKGCAAEITTELIFLDVVESSSR